MASPGDARLCQKMSWPQMELMLVHSVASESSCQQNTETCDLCGKVFCEEFHLVGLWKDC